MSNFSGRFAVCCVSRSAAILLLAIVAACSSPRGFLRPVEPVAGTDNVVMLAATTRAPVDNPDILFGGERGETVSYKRIVVSLPPGREVGTIQQPRRIPGNPATDFAVNSITPISRADIAATLQTARPQKRRVFVFVHGYNTPFDRAVFRFAQLAHDVDADAVPVLFSWPSRGHLLDYKRDLDNATYSRTDLAELLLAAVRSPSIDEVVILAHSMGGWLAVEAVRQIALQQHEVPAKITNLILASPDLDIGVFRRQVEDMGPMRPQITLFIAQNDRALLLSRLISRGGSRLGAIDLSQEEYKGRLAGLSGVTVLDLSALNTGDRVNHALYASSPEAVRLIGDRLLNGQVITDIGMVGPAWANAMSSAATLAVATPVLIFDAASRRNQ